MKVATKYVLHPGKVMTGGKPEYIGSHKLARLYNVPISQCVTPPEGERFSSFYYRDGMVHLHPRESGQYPNLGAPPVARNDG